jgi:hypothetical protein
VAAPANDNIANATVLAAGTSQISGDNSESTVEPGEVRGQGGTSLAGFAHFTVWFRWTATKATAATFTPTTSWNSIITIWRAKSGVSDPVTAFADLEIVESAASSSVPVTFTPTLGRTYYIQLAGVNFASSGPYVLSYPSPGFSLFTSQTPTGTNNSDGSPGITTATSLMFAQAGVVNAIRFYATTTVSGTYTGALWQVTDNDDPAPGAGTLLGSKVRPTSPTAGTWNLITFDTPIAVTSGVLYRAGVHSSAGRYVTTSSFFGTALTNGDITAPESGTDPVGLGTLRQGVFEVNAALTYPDTTFSLSNYFVDVDFTPGGGGGPTTTNGTATVTGAGSTSATASVTLRATATVTGVGSRTAGAVVRAGSTVTGAGATTASAGGTVTGTSTVTGAGSRTATAGIRSTATRTGAGSTSATARTGAGATATGAGTTTANAGGTATGSASVTGTGSTSAAAATAASSTVTGLGATAATASSILRATATVLGIGTTAANAGGTATGSATVTGAGSVSAAGRNTGTATVVGLGTTTATIRIAASSTVVGAGATAAGAGQVFNGTSTVLGAGYTVATSGSKITPRPFAGTTARPYAGTTARP